jgi:hypothetical protein
MEEIILKAVEIPIKSESHKVLVRGKDQKNVRFCSK